MRVKARESKPPETIEQYNDYAAAVEERIRQAIERIIALEVLEIEICGLGVWVGGDAR